MSSTGFDFPDSEDFPYRYVLKGDEYFGLNLHLIDLRGVPQEEVQSCIQVRTPLTISHLPSIGVTACLSARARRSARNPVLTSLVVAWCPRDDIIVRLSCLQCECAYLNGIKYGEYDESSVKYPTAGGGAQVRRRTKIGGQAISCSGTTCYSSSGVLPPTPLRSSPFDEDPRRRRSPTRC